MSNAFTYADAVARNLGLKFSGDDRIEVARLFKVAMSSVREEMLAARKEQE